MRTDLSAMDAIFKPTSIAVIGASDNPGKLGFHVMKSLTAGKFPGRIFPINPGRDEIFGIKAFPGLDQVPEEIDLSIVVLPAELVPQTIRECEAKGIRGMVLITAGFKEIEDKRGETLQKEIKDLADRSGIKIIGPNTFGVANLHYPVNASFTPEFSWAKKGGISLVSQSGGMSHLMGFLSMENRVGLSKVIGLGNRCNVDFADMVQYLIEDPDTQVIAMYLEGIDNPKALVEVAKRARGKKPIIAYKAGRSITSDKASLFHTGSLAGRHEIYEGAFRQAAILSVRSSEELLDSAKALTLCPLPNGKNVAVLSGQAGPGMIACDVCELEGLSIPPFSGGTQEKVERLLPPLAIRTNPVDMGPAWYDSEATKGIVEAVLEDPGIDAIVLCIMFASANRAAAGTLCKLLQKRKADKTIVSCFSAPKGIWDDEIQELERSGIPNYPTPERAAKTLANLLRYREMTRPLSPANPAARETEVSGPILVADIISTIRREGRKLLPYEEGKKLLEKWGIPVAPSKVATDKEGASDAARLIGFPVVMKILSPDIVHKSDAGGVVTDLRTEEEVTLAFEKMMKDVKERRPAARIEGVIIEKMLDGVEVILGVTKDSQFGHVLMFGMGGIFVELLKDTSFRMIPIQPADAEDMIKEVKGYALLEGFRGKRGDADSLKALLLKTSDLITHYPEIAEIDLNPVITSPSGSVVADVRIQMDV